MRNDLNRRAKIVAAAFLLDNVLVNPAGRNVVGLIGRPPGEPLVVAKVEIRLRTVVGNEYLAMLKIIMQGTAGIRRPGAASLDLAYVAAGRIDGFWEIGLSPWDTAAGTLLITEAGGLVGTLSGGRYKQGGNIIAGAPKVYEEMLRAFAPHVPEALREN